MADCGYKKRKEKKRRRFSILIYNLVTNPHDKGLPNPVQNELSNKDGVNEKEADDESYRPGETSLIQLTET